LRIDKQVVEEEINTEEDLVIAVNTVVFKKKVTCRNIVSENYKRNINAGEINAWDINAGDINAWDINAGEINAWDINAREINAREINAWDINAGDINAWDINAGDINAWDINAGDINAWDINAWDINAGDINADFVVCEERKLKSKTSKTICKNLVTKRSTYEKKETEVKQ